jgi:hypothetical protein
VEPAPGYEDPAPGKIRFLPMGVDEAGIALSDLVHGRRRVFEPEPIDPDAGPPPPAFSRSIGERSAATGSGSQRTGGAAPWVSIDVQVSFSPEEIERVSGKSILAAAEFARVENGIVARKLYELDKEFYSLEQARRTAWGR